MVQAIVIVRYLPMYMCMHVRTSIRETMQHVTVQCTTTYLHSIASSNDLKTLGLPLKKLCIDTKESIAVPEVKS